MLSTVIEFIKSPDYKEEESNNLKYKFSILMRLLVLSLVISLVLALVIGMVESNTPLDLGDHAMDRFLDAYPLGIVLLAAVLLAPILEELIFRGPLIFFRANRYFGLVFYLFTLTFGFYHITNYSLSKEVLLFSPLLVAPQICVGIILGYARIRLGLLWAMLLHSLYNLVLIGPVLLFKILKIPLA